MATNTARIYPTFSCEVCGTSTRFHHLDAKICSACSSFYRRAIREGLQYRCELNQRCQTGKGRYACRSCRFSKCKELGAQLPTTTSSDTTVSKEVSPKLSKTVFKQPVLDQLIAGYELFHDAQRSLISLNYPEVQFKKDMLIATRKKEKIELKEKCVPLLMDFFNTNFGPFGKLTRAEKKDLVVEISHDFETYSSFYLTSKYFPKPDSTCLMDSAITYMDFNPIYTDYYYEGFIMPFKLDDYVGLMQYPIKKMLSHLNKYKKWRLRKVDVVCFIFLALWKKIEQKDLLTGEMQAYREQLIAEWTTNSCRQYGLVEGPHHLGRMLVLFYETDTMIEELTKHILLSQIHLDKTETELLCGISEYMKKLDLGEDD